jgi:hypothetical protein
MFWRASHRDAGVGSYGIEEAAGTAALQNRTVLKQLLALGRELVSNATDVAHARSPKRARGE